jgi:structural maintenance of chromosome 1
MNIIIKARNFLVFQGDVEAIASKSPKDLTKLLEQISGSEELKEEYDTLKRQVDKATEQSTFAFNKKKGINNEMKQFKEQREEALRYEKLQGEKDTLIIKHFLWKLYHMEQEITALKDEIEKDTELLDKHKSENKTVDQEFKNLKKNQAKIQKDLLAVERNISKAVKEIESKNPEKLSAEEQLNYAKKQHDKLLEQTHRCSEEFKRQHELLTKEEEKLAAVEEEYKAFEADVTERQEKLQNLSREQKKEYDSIMATFECQTMFERKELESLERQNFTNQDLLNRLDEKVKQHNDRTSQIDEEAITLTLKKEKIENVIKTTTDEIKSTENELREAENERKRLAHEENMLTQEQNSVLSQLMCAKIDRKQSEKQRKLKETVEVLRRIFPGVHGRLIDLCKPIQRKYDLAVSIILNKNLDAVVVDNDKVAMECINYMKENRIGTLTFLPLSSIQNKPIHDKYRSFVRGGRLAIDIIKCEPAFEKAVHFACGNTMVCDTEEIAKFICYEKRQAVKTVTIEGTVIHKSGFITGGQSPNDNAQRFEEQEVESLKATRDKLTIKLNELAMSKRKFTADAPLKNALVSLQSRLEFAKEDLNATVMKLKSIDLERAHIISELQDIEKERVVVLSLPLNANIEKLKTKMSEAKQEYFKEFCKKAKISNVNEFESAQLEFVEEMNAKKIEYANQISKLQNEIIFQRNRYEEEAAKMEQLRVLVLQEESKMNEMRKKSSTYQEDIQNIKKRMNEFEAEKENMTEQIENLNGEMLTLKRKLFKTHSNVETYQKGITSREALLERLFEERQSIFRKCALENIQIPKINDENAMDVDGDLVQVDFTLLDNESKQNSTETMDVWFQDRIKNIGVEMERMAPNMKAIDRLDSVEDRLRSTNETFEQARKEAKDLKDQFSLVKKERFRRFNEAYSHIAKMIDVIYKDLTKSRSFPLGGTAYLSLEDSDVRKKEERLMIGTL